MRQGGGGGITSARCVSMGNQATKTDIISGEHAYESIVPYKSIVPYRLVGLFDSAQRLVLHRAHRFDRLGNIFRGQHAGQTREDRVGVERGVGLENAP